MIRLQELELVFGQTDGRTDGWTDRRDVGNSILDYRPHALPLKTQEIDEKIVAA